MTPRTILPRAIMVAALCSSLLGLGCNQSHVRPAPFRARPDSTAPGDLRGPFTGRVVDAGTQRPISGAIVYATWSYTGGRALPTPSGFQERVTSTNADGRYEIPALGELPGDGVRVASFQLVIYKRGYVAYRSDRRFLDFGPRLDFAQRRNDVELAQWRSDLSHARHLRYIGGGAQMASLTAWETAEAAQELGGSATSGGRRTSDPFVRGTTDVAAAVVASRLLTPADIKEVTGFEGSFESGPLGDEPDSAQYSSLHLRAVGRQETFDVALRLWKLDASDAQQRFGQLMDSLPGAEEHNEIGDRSLRASEGEIHGVAVLDGKRGTVLLLTCGAAQCRNPEDAVAIARAVYEKLEDLWPNSSQIQGSAQ